MGQRKHDDAHRPMGGRGQRASRAHTPANWGGAVLVAHEFCPECQRGEMIGGKCDRCGFVPPAPSRPLAALKEAEQRTAGVEGRKP